MSFYTVYCIKTSNILQALNATWPVLLAEISIILIILHSHIHIHQICKCSHFFKHCSAVLKKIPLPEMTGGKPSRHAI